MAVDGAVGFGVGVDAGVVDDGVDVPEGVDGVGQLAALGEAGEVADDDVGPGVLQRFEGAGSLLVAGMDDRVVPGVEQCFGGGETEPGRRSGDEDSRHGKSCVTSPRGEGGTATASWVAAQEPRTRSRSSEADPGSARRVVWRSSWRGGRARRARRNRARRCTRSS